MIVLPGMENYTKTFMALEYEPLTVTARLVKTAQVVAYDPPPYLDGLLAWAVLQVVTAGQGVPQNTPEAFWIPLPLKCLWVSPEEWPLWAASVFMPQSDVIHDTTHVHKRNPLGEFSRSARWNTKAGRWMERRRPLPTSGCDVWQARCIGNREWIERLLVQNVAFLGKARGIGFGEVADWEVAPAAFVSPVVDGGRLIHALPVDYPDKPCITEAPQRVGWTPPQWKRSLFSTGWPVGTRVASMDWFSDLPDAV